MKPATQKTPPIQPDTLERTAVEAVVREATRAAAPDYYVQKATGRALTRLVFVVGGLQVGGVFLWLALVFAGVVDASMNLDGFMVSQLGVFLASIAVGLAVTVRHLKKVRADAEQLEPGVAAPMMDLLGGDVQWEDTDRIDRWVDEHSQVQQLIGDARPGRVFTGQVGDRSYGVMDMRGDAESGQPRGLLLMMECPTGLEGELIVEPADNDCGQAWEQADQWSPVPMSDEKAAELLSVEADDPQQAERVVEGAAAQAMTQFCRQARRRDRLAGRQEGAGDFTVFLGPESVVVVRRSEATLFPADDDAEEAAVDELMAAAREIRAAGQVAVEVCETGGQRNRK